ncbi:MAG: hypothetical protein BSR46_14840 [Candidatus Dactylopiibacterium carminicum]|nr:MAG: hypothetical protein BSR46_14840 [Candidatus Dactylopiibacterium carminicum]
MPPALQRIRQGVWIFYVATVLMLVVASVWFTKEDYYNTLAAAQRQALSLARSLDEHITRSFVSVDQAMQNVAEDIERAGGMDRVDEHWAYERLKSKVENTPQIRAIIAIDSKGVLRAHGLEYPTRRVSLSDRSYFPYHQKNIETRLRIGEPIISRTDYKWLIPLTRRVNVADNNFGGVLLSGVEPDYFLRFYESLHLERGTRVEILRNDGVILLNYPLNIHVLGTPLNEILPASYELLLRLRHGFERMDYAEEDRFVAQLQSSSSLPLTVRVSLDAGQVLQHFYQSAWVRALSGLFAIFILSVMLYLLLRQIRRLAESEARLHLTQYTVDESPDMILWCTSDGRLCYANRLLGEVCGLSQSQLATRNITELLTDGALAWERLRADLLEHQSHHSEGFLSCSDDKRVPVAITLAPLTDAGRDLYCVTLRDISERYAAETELRRHRDHLQELVSEQTREIRNILDASPLAIMLSVNEQVQLINPAFETLFGYEQQSITGLPEQLVYLSQEEYNKLRGALHSRISMGGTFRAETQLRRREGGSFWASLFARALDPQDLAKGVVFIFEDVNAQRSAALALKQSERSSARFWILLQMPLPLSIPSASSSMSIRPCAG